MAKYSYFKIFMVSIVLFNLCLSSSSSIASGKTTLINERSPYKTGENIQQINITFESSNYTLYGEIYYPLNESVTYPGIVFCEGFGGFISAYNWMPKALAEQGYVAMIFDPPGQGKSEGILPTRGIHFPLLNLYYRFGFWFETKYHYSVGEWETAVRDALTYLLEESPVTSIINTSCVGLIGHSLGGKTVTEVAAQDDRIDAVVALSHGTIQIVNDIDVPIQFQGGGFDIPLHSVSTMLQCYRRSNVPKELVMIAGGTHWGFTTAFGRFCPCPRWQKEISIRYATGWFDYFLKNKPEAYGTITTGVDHLSRVVRSKYNFGDGDIILE